METIRFSANKVHLKVKRIAKNIHTCHFLKTARLLNRTCRGPDLQGSKPPYRDVTQRRHPPHQNLNCVSGLYCQQTDFLFLNSHSQPDPAISSRPGGRDRRTVLTSSTRSASVRYGYSPLEPCTTRPAAPKTRRQRSADPEPSCCLLNQSSRRFWFFLIQRDHTQIIDKTKIIGIIWTKLDQNTNVFCCGAEL